MRGKALVGCRVRRCVLIRGSHSIRVREETVEMCPSNTWSSYRPGGKPERSTHPAGKQTNDVTRFCFLWSSGFEKKRLESWVQINQTQCMSLSLSLRRCPGRKATSTTTSSSFGVPPTKTAFVPPPPVTQVPQIAFVFVFVWNPRVVTAAWPFSPANPNVPK